MHALLLTAALILAQGPPNQLHFQARVADAGGNALNGPLSIQVRIYDVPSGGAPLFAETHPATALNGVVNLLLGSLVSLPTTLFDGTDRFLTIQVGADPEMLPRRRIACVPFATRAAGLAPGSALPAGLITSTHILDGTIAAADLAANSVDSSKIVNESITAADIGADAVSSSEIKDGAVATADLADASVTALKLAASSVNGANVVDGSLTAADLANATIVGGKIAAGTITAGNLAASAIGSTQVADGAVTLPKLAHPLTTSASGFALEIETSSTTGVALRLEATAATGTPAALQATTAAPSTIPILGQSNSTTGSLNFGVRGQIASTTGGGAGVIGEAMGVGSSADGVRGITPSPSGYAVWGDANAATGNAYGVRGDSSSTSGIGVIGSASSTTGSVKGVEGIVSSTSGIGVLGDSNATSGLAFGVSGFTSSPSGMGVYGRNLGVSSGSGIMGESGGTNGTGVEGKATGTGNAHGVSGFLWGASTLGAGVFGGVIPGGTGNGVVGDASSAAFDAVRAEGDFTATGFKSFAQPHPTDSTREIRFVCLEGNESGTYFRGSAKLKGGVAVIEVPEEFRLVSESAGLTVQLTPVGKAQLWCESRALDRIVVGGDRDVEFDYLVNGVRRGFASYEPYRANRSYVPRYGDVPYGTQYPEAVRKMLVANGTLNADFTPNAETAARNGWVLRNLAEAHPDLSEVVKRVDRGAR